VALLALVAPRLTASTLAAPPVLILNPTSADRPWIAAGETYHIPGSFRATLLHAGTSQAEIRLLHG
jgi:hypothetical protein